MLVVFAVWMRLQGLEKGNPSVDSHVKNDLTQILPKTAYKLERALMSHCL